MTSHPYESVTDDGLFLALVRGRFVPPGGLTSLDEGVRAASARDVDRDGLADAVSARLRDLGAPDESLAAAERLRAPGATCVVAGQQPVLFGGPHFVATKALAAVALARRVEAAGTPCVPVFWAATEDHDHGEVDHVDVLDAHGEAVTLRVPLPGDRRMLSRVPMPPEAEVAHAQLATALPRGPGHDVAVRAARAEIGDSVGAAFARTLLRLLGTYGLVVVEPHVVAPFARGLVEHEISRPGGLADEIVAAEEAMERGGFRRPVGLRPARPLFLVVGRDGRRHAPPPPPADGDALLAWRARLTQAPERLSWNVAGRVLAQDVALPVAAQVCGPSEFGYCAALGAAHARLGVRAPALVARPGVTFAPTPAAPPDPSQERRVSILPYVARHGSGILDRVLAAAAGGAEHVVLGTGGA